MPLKKVDAGVRLGITKFSDWGTQSYVVSKKGARRILERFPKIVNRTDHTLHAYWENGLNVCSLETPVVFDGNEAGGHSFLQEAKDTRPGRNLWKLPYRALSNLREEVLKRVYFSRQGQERQEGRRYGVNRGEDGAVEKVLIGRGCGFLP